MQFICATNNNYTSPAVECGYHMEHIKTLCKVQSSEVMTKVKLGKKVNIVAKWSHLEGTVLVL
jgi:hypothetical protein